MPCPKALAIISKIVQMYFMAAGRMSTCDKFYWYALYDSINLLELLLKCWHNGMMAKA
jgi:hypothetical protein